MMNHSFPYSKFLLHQHDLESWFASHFLPNDCGDPLRVSANTHWTLGIFNTIFRETPWSKATSTGAVPTKPHAEVLVTAAEPSIVSTR